MARRTMKIRYKLTITRRVRIRYRVHVSVTATAVVRSLAERYRSNGWDPADEEVRNKIRRDALAQLPPDTSDDEVLAALDDIEAPQDE